MDLTTPIQEQAGAWAGDQVSRLLDTTALTPYHIYCDFEYRQDGCQLILGCFLCAETGERVAIDFRQPGATVLLRALQARWADATWLAYAAHAEVTAFLTAGLDVGEMQWICLQAEARQITASHPRYFLAPRMTNLLSTLHRLDIACHTDRARKNHMRDVILASDQYTEEQWQDIVRYCWDDIEPLPELWWAIRCVHAEVGKTYSAKTAIYHGEYIKALARLEHRSRGFPIDVPKLHRIYANRTLVMRSLAERAIGIYGPVFRRAKLTGDYSFWFAGLDAHIEQQPVPVDWARTPSGRRRMDEQYLVEFVEANRQYLPLKETFFLLRHFASTDLRPLLHGNFLKGLSLPMHTATGRNQPMVRRGFILNMQPWLRELVRPEPDHVLIAADWSQQEIVIAASLSGDTKLREALETGDVYLALARMAGAVPADATKETHPLQRQLYKSVQLGLIYGMGVRTLAKAICFDLNSQGHKVSIEETTLMAREILGWHQETFIEFWSYTHEVVEEAQRDCFIRTFDGWTAFANQNTSPTKLGNFPCQAGAAVMLREAVKFLAEDGNLEMTCTLHDAIYIYAHVRDADAHEAVLRRCMEQATTKVLARTVQPLPIKVDTKRFDHTRGYYDKRDTTTMPTILGILDQAGV